MQIPLRPSLLALLLTALPLAACGADKNPTFTDPAKAGPDYALQGEYAGEVNGAKLGVQVIALGDGKFEAVLCPGGLPGDGWDGKQPRTRIASGGTAETPTFSSEGFEATLGGGALKLSSGGTIATLPKVERESTTLGAAPPAGAVVLFDGSSADGWEGGRTTEDGLLMEGCTSKEKFGDHSLHIEFLLPFKPKARGQGRGNSGIYLQSRYEVQMLDSFGLKGETNECGGLYKIARPMPNMCYPPLRWQTYDIDFTAARWEGDKKVANARIAVRHNGVVIHEDVELPNSTTASKAKEGNSPGGVYLQNHGNPVRYRNIWVVPK